MCLFDRYSQFFVSVPRTFGKYCRSFDISFMIEISFMYGELR